MFQVPGVDASRQEDLVLSLVLSQISQVQNFHAKLFNLLIFALGSSPFFEFPVKIVLILLVLVICRASLR